MVPGPDLQTLAVTTVRLAVRPFLGFSLTNDKLVLTSYWPYFYGTTNIFKKKDYTTLHINYIYFTFLSQALLYDVVIVAHLLCVFVLCK